MMNNHDKSCVIIVCIKPPKSDSGRSGEGFVQRGASAEFIIVEMNIHGNYYGKFGTRTEM